LAIGAAAAWPKYRLVTYLGLGLISLLAIVAGAFALFLIVACVQGECV